MTGRGYKGVPGCGGGIWAWACSEFVCFLMFIYLEGEREREREREWGGAEREGDTESEAGSRH